MVRSKKTSARGVFTQALKSLFENEGPKTAAAIAYFTLFSLFPALLVLIAVSDQFIGLLDLREKVIQKIIELVPVARQLIIESIEKIAQPSWGLLFSCLIIFFWSSSWVFMFVENALNRAWGVTSKRTFWRSRLLMLGMVLLCCTLLAISITLTGIIAAVRSITAHIDPYIMPQSVTGLFWQFTLGFIGLVVTIAAFTLIYKIVPNVKVRFLEALTGAILSGVMWQIANYAFVRSLPYFDYQEVYGSVAAVISLMSWVYLSSLIMLFGAYFSVYMHRPSFSERRPEFPSTQTLEIGISFPTERPRKGNLN